MPTKLDVIWNILKYFWRGKLLSFASDGYYSVAIAQWIPLHLPFIGPRFKSRAHHLHGRSSKSVIYRSNTKFYHLPHTKANWVTLNQKLSKVMRFSTPYFVRDGITKCPEMFWDTYYKSKSLIIQSTQRKKFCLFYTNSLCITICE